jgi:hypothetical protein
MDLGGTVEVSTSDGLHASPQIFERKMNILVLGVCMFSVFLEPGTEDIGLSTRAEEPGGQLFHKVFLGLITPFGLPIECFPIYEAMLDREQWRSLRLCNMELWSENFINSVLLRRKFFPILRSLQCWNLWRSVFLEAGLWAYFVLCWQLWL